MPEGVAPATAFAATLLTQLTRLGVRDLVVAPGSRSQALAFVAAELERAGLIRLHVRIDERAAGFLALGIGLESGRPAAIITTSGSAVANLHPAILEAHHGGVPLLVLSADRPAELHGIGANQTTVQAGIFPGVLRGEWDVPAPRGAADDVALAERLATEAWHAACGGADAGPAGPVHLNLAFADPLSSPWTAPTSLGPLPEIPENARGGSLAARTAPSPSSHALPVGPRTAVVAGTGAGPGAEALARDLGALLFAEVTSGAHFGPHLVVPYREVIRDADFLAGLERVILLGRPTLSREVPWLVEHTGVELIGVRGPGPEAFNPGRAVSCIVDEVVVTEAATDVLTELQRTWVRPWVQASRAFLEDSGDIAPEVDLPAGPKARRELEAVREPVTRRALVDAVWRSSWPHDVLVLGASRLIRELDRTAPGKALRVHANRGLAGIDGTVSTSLGIAIAQQLAAPASAPAAPTDAAAERRRTGVTRVLLGDLAFLHDVGGLALPPAEAAPRIMLIVGDDGGGSIFELLEAGQAAQAAGGAAAESFDRVMRTPQRVDIESLARAYGWAHRRVATRGELDPALSACTGPTIVEVPLTR